VVEMLNTRRVGHLDCADSGQVGVEWSQAHMGYMHRSVRTTSNRSIRAIHVTREAAPLS
jgi:hypothetical protein